jgi:acyl dehydratase
MSEYRHYDEVAVGDVFPAEPLRFMVTREKVASFLQATGNRNPAYASGTGQAPSMMAAIYLIELLRHRKSPPGGIHAKQAIRFHRPLAVNETLLLQGWVVEKYLRKERPYVVSDFEARGDDGELVASGRVTSIWGKDP